MIRHCVMFKWKDDVTAEQLAAFVEGLKELGEGIDTVRGFAYGDDIGINEGNHDLCVTVDFDDEAGYAVYRDDADHQAFIAAKVRPILASRAGVQFEF